MALPSVDETVQAIISKLRAVSTLVTDNNVREQDYQAPDIGFPCLRVTAAVSPNECRHLVVNFSVTAFSEAKSSRQAKQIMDEVVNGLHESVLTGHGVTSMMIWFRARPGATNEEALWKDTGEFGVIVTAN